MGCSDRAVSTAILEIDGTLVDTNYREIADGWTTSGDVERTKPAPDLVHAALELVGDGPDCAVMVGDTPWDVRSAAEAGVETSR
jgi:phosphoglycolate phosphatase-like HAD superfamily hydrolase